MSKLVCCIRGLHYASLVFSCGVGPTCFATSDLLRRNDGENAMPVVMSDLVERVVSGQGPSDPRRRPSIDVRWPTLQGYDEELQSESFEQCLKGQY